MWWFLGVALWLLILFVAARVHRKQPNSATALYVFGRRYLCVCVLCVVHWRCVDVCVLTGLQLLVLVLQ
jgi:hypothetical protein